MDKKNIRTIIHHSLPPTVESYLQESGRAGRDRKKSLAVLLLGTDDRKRAMGVRDKIGNGSQDNKNLQINEDSHADENYTADKDDKDDEDDAEAAARERSRELFLVMISNKTCRRTAMLELLGCDHDSCSGCDVCTHSVVTKAQGEKEILDAVRSRPNRFIRIQWADILSCHRKLTAFSYAYWHIRRFGALLSWYPDDIRQAIESLSEAECIKTSKKRPYRGVLKAGKKSFTEYLFSEAVSSASD